MRAGLRQINDAAIEAWADKVLKDLETLVMPGEEPGLEKMEATAELEDVVDPPLPVFLDDLAGHAGLDKFETRVLILCLLANVDSDLVDLARDIQGMDGPFPGVTVALLLALYPDGHHAAFTAEGRLQRHGLVRLRGDHLYEASLHLDPAVLGYLMTGKCYETAFAGLTSPLASGGPFCSSHEKLVDKAENILLEGVDVLQLVGRDRHLLQNMAAAASSRVNWQAILVSAGQLPPVPEDLADFAIRWRRYAALHGGMMVLDATGLTALDKDFTQTSHILRQFIELSRCMVILLAKEPLNFEFSSVVSLRVLMPDREEIQGFWKQVLYGVRCRLITDANPQEEVIEIDDAADKKFAAELAAGFAFSPSDIADTAVGVWSVLSEKQKDTDQPRLSFESSDLPKWWRDLWWQSAREMAQPDFGGLARYVPAKADFSALVTDVRTEQALQQIVSQFKARALVRGEWGLEPALQRGNGITVLLAGVSGTGKTLAAEVIANALSLDLYQIDLSQLVSKYIGETQKNLSRIFEAAEKGGAVLLFDEADALFSRRTDVRDSRDRHANMEVGFLLQRMEEYSGVALLTTNLKDNLDDAFLRRLQYVIDFPFPGAELRARLWETLLPSSVPVAGTLPDPAVLARLSLSGAQIRNVIRRAVYEAAAGSGKLELKDLLAATQAELEKSDRALSEQDLKGMLAC